MLYTVSTARVVFIMGLDIFNLRREHIWTCSVLGGRNYEIKKVTESRQQGIKT